VNPICPYCRMETGTGEGERIDCPGCGTPHHPDCFQENGGCTVFGCSHAPVDEPKLSVTGTDLAGNTYSYERPATPIVYSTLGLQGTAAAATTAPAVAPSSPRPQPPPPMSSTAAAPPPPPATGSTAAPHASSYQALYYLQPTPAELYASIQEPKRRVTFVLLGIFLGIFGVHNFYAGYMRKGAAQLCLTLFTFFYGAIISWIWAMVEVCMIHEDFDGVQFT
jgi:TM2 domain-containing membrane protein YozV